MEDAINALETINALINELHKNWITEEYDFKNHVENICPNITIHNFNGEWRVLTIKNIE